MKTSITLLTVLLLAPLAVLPAADLTFAGIFTDHAVLQRDEAAPVWGWAAPNEQVTVEFAGQRKSATADDAGKWLARLDPMPASAEGRELVVQSAIENRKSKITDVVVGDVWLCSGQSNIHFRMNRVENSRTEIAAADNLEKQLQNPPGIPSQSDFDRIRRDHVEHANELFENVLKSGKIAPLQGGFAFMDSNAGDKTMKSEEQSKADKVAFEQALAGDWKEVLSDAGTGDWTKQWFLDGEVGTVTNSPEGMTLTAGPEFKNDAHHMVLWTTESFSGDLKIEYDYTRLDQATSCVNILYIQATGMGEAPYVADITQWNALRKVPSMAMYHDYMNTYHISFAVNSPEKGDYVRARRYMPKGDKVEKGKGAGLSNTDLEPDYFNTGMFAPGQLHHFTIIKRGQELFMKVTNKETTKYFHWRNTKAPGIESGRIGLRHMFTRSARYANFRVSTPKPAPETGIGF